MDKVKAWLSNIGGNFSDLYAEDFARDGWDDIESIHLMSEADVKLLIPKPGHSARVWNAIQTLQQSLRKQERQESDRTKTPVNNRPTYSQKSLPFCDGGEKIIPGEKKPWQRLSIWYPYPKQKRCIFSNEMLPRMYRAAYAYLQTKFETYFCYEIAKRYERKQKFEKWEHFIDFKLSSNDAAYGKFLQLPPRPKRDHIKQCQNAIAEFDMKKAEITKELEQVQASYNNLFDSSGIIPRKWATEQISYESSIKEGLSNMIARLDSGIQQIRMTEQSLKDLFPHMASNNGTTRNRKIKEGRRKAKHRKSERLNAAALVLLQTITSEDIVNLCFPEEHKSLGLSQHYVTAEQINESVLKEMLKKQRNVEALEKLRSLEVFSMDSLVLIESLCAMNEDIDED